MNPANAISPDEMMDDVTAVDPAAAGKAPGASPAAAAASPAALAPSARDASPQDPSSRRTLRAAPDRNWIERLYDRAEAFISRLSMRDNFWNSVCSLIWLPLAFFSGLRMKEIDANTFVARAVLPFRRFNRNWYRAMAGGALLANSEIAGGSYVFGIVGADYTVVCKHLDYKFLRPCLGPAVYRIRAREDVKALMAAGSEFNITVDMDVLQQAGRVGEKDKRVGQCVSTFHVTPKKHHQVKRQRRAK